MTVNIEIFSKNLDITDRVRTYITKKVAKLDRFLSNIDEARVDLESVKSARNASDRNVAQITIRGRGYILRTEERSDDVFAAIDLSVDKMERKIERFKGKHSWGRGDGTPASEVAQETPESEEAGETQAVIARRKHFTLVPMSKSEALEQMALLGHENFFVFYNVETNSINVLYHRRDGTYGIIQPEIG